MREDFDGRFNFCRGYYSSNRPEAGGQGWRTDYPGADNNFSVRLSELSFVRVKMKPDGQPDNVVIRLTDPLLYRCGVLYMEDVGTALQRREVESLRAFLLKGGFLEVDDFWGSASWEQWTKIDRVLPPNQYRSSSADHAVMHAVRREGGRAGLVLHRRKPAACRTRIDSPQVNFRGIQDEAVG